MSDPTETSDNVRSIADGSGQAGLDKNVEEQGSDVGGPASTMESGVEQLLTGDDSATTTDEPDSQSKNPL